MSEIQTARYGFTKGVTRGFLVFVVVAACLATQGLSQRRKQASPQPGKRQGKAQVRKDAPTIPPEVLPEIRAALDRISADSLRGHLSFIASDLLEGRNTPSRGLEIASEYIAAQFRRAGLEPAGDTGYFQNAGFLSVEQARDGFA